MAKKRAFSLLLTLCDKNEPNFATAVQLLFNFHSKINRSWQFVDYKETDVGVKEGWYVGLKNFGCTCYMNSLLQQLYMIPALRKAILELPFDVPILSQSNMSKEEL